MRSTFFAALLALPFLAQAALNGSCTGKVGVCLTTSSCSASGGTSHSGYCPNDAADVKCCTKSCGSGGTCRLTSTCGTGKTATGLCPGNSGVTCCLPASSGGSKATKLTQAQAEAKLKPHGITWSSSGNCKTRSNASCTSLASVRTGTIDGVIAVKKASGATVVITGGTEVGHSTANTQSHYNGWKLDLRPNTKLDTYLKKFTKMSNRSDGWPRWKDSKGNIYCLEGNHWDILWV